MVVCGVVEFVCVVGEGVGVVLLVIIICPLGSRVVCIFVCGLQRAVELFWDVGYGYKSGSLVPRGTFGTIWYAGSGGVRGFRNSTTVWSFYGSGIGGIIR